MKCPNYIHQLIVVRDSVFFGAVVNTSRDKACQLRGTVETPYGERVRVECDARRVWRACDAGSQPVAL